jgi:hypothetical protein
LIPFRIGGLPNLNLSIGFIANEASDGLKLQGTSKLLSLTQHLSDPQTVIDLLLSVCACDSDPDMIEKVIPNLCKAIKLRDHFGNESNQDVLGFLELVIPISTTQLR